MNVQKLLVITSLLLVPLCAVGNVTVGVTSTPGDYWGLFSGRIMGADAGDITPNPCWNQNMPGACELRFFVINEYDIPSGGVREDGWSYSTSDKGVKPWGIDTWRYQTIGMWWGAAQNKWRSFTDNLTIGLGTNPCIILAASKNDEHPRLITGTIVSNCAKGIIQARTCRLEPEQIVLKMAGFEGGGELTSYPQNIKLKCSATARAIKISTGNAETIVLDGNSRTKVQLDWGNGWGVEKRLNVKEGWDNSIDVRAKTSGAAELLPGEHRGSAVVNIFYE
ncbi:hypothetical protein [Serratia fonticola]|uniref:hypothetical protein n=1 Tax=Serratia fonticola TaxID=47917 RepID=UPI0013767EC4|nr:hypothetical protein [Serratia fonticola]MBC3218436.1 hypothetical protein [Serratia fonticola]NCG52758.1 hypothetical protein [Serratia fonticola]